MQHYYKEYNSKGLPFFGSLLGKIRKLIPAEPDLFYVWLSPKMKGRRNIRSVIELMREARVPEDEKEMTDLIAEWMNC